MPTVTRVLACLFGAGLFAFLGGADAAIQVQATRVVYSGQANGASLSLRNMAAQPYMVQAWLDTGDADTIIPKGLPIVVTPPLMRLDPSRESQLRFIYSGKGLPGDRESVFWINVQEIPPRPEEENVLQIAIRTRIKLFFRPPGLNQTLPEAAGQLQWRVQGDTLVVTNPSKLHVTFSKLNLDEDKTISKFETDMVAPGETAVVLSNLPAAPARLSYEIINDYGGGSTFGPVVLPAALTPPLAPAP